MSLHKDYFWSLEPAEFALISKGFSKRRREDQESDLFNTRTIAYYSFAPHVKNIPSMDKFMPLDSDKKIKKKKVVHPWADLSEEELKKKFGD